MANASLRDITTAIGTLIDKWTMAAQAGRSREPITIEMPEKAKEYGE